MTTDAQKIYGWFDDATQTEPTYDPPSAAPCLFCGKPVSSDDVRTHCLIYTHQYAARSYFYRTHKSCAETDKTHTAMDGIVLDMIRRNGD